MIQTVTPVSEFVLIYEIAASIVRNGGPLTAPAPLSPLIASTTRTLPSLGLVLAGVAEIVAPRIPIKIASVVLIDLNTGFVT
jgi:hypothetical protein